MSLTDTDLAQVQGLAVAVDWLRVFGGHSAGTVQHQGELGQGACGTQIRWKEKLRRGEAKRLLTADAAISCTKWRKNVCWKHFWDSDACLTQVFQKWMSRMKKKEKDLKQ